MCLSTFLSITRLHFQTLKRMETIVLAISLHFEFAMSEKAYKRNTKVTMCLSADLSCEQLGQYFDMRQLLSVRTDVTEW